MIFRTAQQKADLAGSFNRPDRPFFASGACHILAQAFLNVTELKDWSPSIIIPHTGFRGMHVFTANGRYTFDYHGFARMDRFLDHYTARMNRRFPGWSATILQLDISPVSEEFCDRYNSRLPEDFYRDPWPRANAFVKRFDHPGDV